MLRVLFILLLLANALTYAWTHGHLMFAGLGPVDQREPERLRQQIQPEKLSLRAPTAPAGTRPAPPQPVAALASTAEEATQTPTEPTRAPAEPTTCWFAPGFTPEQATRLRTALEQEPTLAERWTLNESILNARWIVYLGKFASLEALQRSRSELRQSRVDFRDVNVPALQPGLALGTYSSKAAAEQALQDVARAGVRGARVVQERQDSRSVTLRLPSITDTERRQIGALGPALAGKNLQRCP